ncbi:unnamed protein product [Protopolystoma xenopodis]|uniref:Uncharacterized protein n=1 Tax=Protopolystoma xenopodis TaxID=117903 RepID=A0A3S5BN02_9PLAT|nr:unnamed protein product [Protopolystoma xenopodis]
MSTHPLGSGATALFSQLNQGEQVTSNLRKVTKEMKTNKDTALRTCADEASPTKPTLAPKPGSRMTISQKPPLFELRNNQKWIVVSPRPWQTFLMKGASADILLYLCSIKYKCLKGR